MRIFLSILFISICFFSSQAQTILPIPSRENFIKKFDDRSKFYLFGSGDLKFESIDVNQLSSKFTTLFTPEEKLIMFVSINKSIVSQITSSDSISLQNSIIFPDNANFGFLGSIRWSIIKSDNTPDAILKTFKDKNGIKNLYNRYRDLDDTSKKKILDSLNENSPKNYANFQKYRNAKELSKKTDGEYDALLEKNKYRKYTKFEITPTIIEFGYQKRNVNIVSDSSSSSISSNDTTENIANPISTTNTSFEAVSLTLAGMINWMYYGPVNFSATASLNLGLTTITQGFDEFKTIFNINELTQKTFWSYGGKISIQLNALTFSFDAKHYIGSSYNVAQLKGFQFQIGSSVSGNFLEF